jgi:hypothetical protein
MLGRFSWGILAMPLEPCSRQFVTAYHDMGAYFQHAKLMLRIG